MYEHQHGALLILRQPSARQPAVSSTPRQIEARDILKPSRRHGGGRA